MKVQRKTIAPKSNVVLLKNWLRKTDKITTKMPKKGTPK